MILPAILEQSRPALGAAPNVPPSHCSKKGPQFGKGCLSSLCFSTQTSQLQKQTILNLKPYLLPL